MPIEAKYRDYDSSTDESYVHASWKENFFRDGLNKWMPPAVYYGRMNRLVPELIERSRVRVCHNPVDRDHIWGWAVVEEVDMKPVVHYVFVREEYRKRGYAKKLLDGCGLPLQVTHWTRVCESLQTDHALMYHPSKL